MENFQQIRTYVEVHQQEQLINAAKYRLVQELKAQQMPKQPHTATPVVAPLLAQAGEVLSKLGDYLQERYGEVALVTDQNEPPCVTC